MVEWREGHRRGVQPRETFVLPAGAVEVLAEVAVAVEQADPGERYAEIVRRLEVVAGQHAQHPDTGQRGGDAELGGEVGDRAERAGHVPARNQRGSVASAVNSSSNPRARGTKTRSAASSSRRLWAPSPRRPADRLRRGRWRRRRAREQIADAAIVQASKVRRYGLERPQ